MFLVEYTIEGHTGNFFYVTKKWAMAFASVILQSWIEGRFKDRCDSDAAKQVLHLLDQQRCADAMDAWNAASTNSTIWIHEIEFVEWNCHRALPQGHGVLEAFMEGSLSYDIYDTPQEALEMASVVLREWTRRKSPYGQNCDEPTRQQVRQLLRKGQTADAIDAWIASVNDPTVAIHCIRYLKKNCHHDESENELPSCR